MMSFISLFLLFSILPWYTVANHGKNIENFDEQLIIRSLSQGQVFAYFQFKTFVPTSLATPYGVNAGKHNDIFPLSLLRLFHQQEIQELHLSLTKGVWNYEQWGLPIRDTPPNAHLWAWFTSYLNASENWKKLTSLLSGQFCASINLIDPTVTIRPKMSFRPFLQSSIRDIKSSQQYGYMAALPHEAICTENLTPWTKLLPCRTKKGIGSLLQATQIFNSRYFSMSLDFKFSTSDIINTSPETTGIELMQNILVVFNAPLVLDGVFSWTFNSLFGTPLRSVCPLSRSSHVFVDVSHLASTKASQLTVAPSQYVCFVNEGEDHLRLLKADNMNSTPSTSNSIYADYDLHKKFAELAQESNVKKRKALNIGIQYPNSYKEDVTRRVNFSQVQVRRQARGYGVLSGGISVLLTNTLSSDIYAIYLDMIPWYLRMYLHTLVIKTRSLDEPNQPPKVIKPSLLHYGPGKDRERPHHLELLILLPAKSRTEISFEFDHQFLRWTEFPPDANHGLYINPATVTFFFANVTTDVDRFLSHFFAQLSHSDVTSVDNVHQQLQALERYFPLLLYTEPILISMPTPDFSMPYNVVCLVSTVLSIAFGPIYNLTTRRTKIIRKYLDTGKKDTEVKQEDAVTTAPDS